MLAWLNKRVNPNPRLLRLLALLLYSIPLICWSGLFVIVLAPLAVHEIVGFKRTAKRDIWRACLSPSMLLLPICLGFWIRSHEVTSYYLVSAGDNEFVGTYLLPGVIEIGWYESDPGSEYLDPIACMFGRYYCRYVPVDAGWFTTETRYAVDYTNQEWTPGSFYAHAGSWWQGSPYRTVHVGFHFIVPTGLSLVFFVLGIRRWRTHKRRLRRGLCVSCGYDLTGNESGVCPECGQTI